MALSDYDKHLVFEVLDIPNSVSVLYIDTNFGTGKTSETGAILVSRDEVVARIDALTADLEVRLQELLAAWKKVAVSGTRLEANAANQGVNYNPGRQRARIRLLVQKILPVFLERDLRPGGELQLA